LVGFGSATGNSEFIAKRIHAELQEKHGLKRVQLFALNDWKKLSDPTFEEYQAGIFVCATTGNGDAPENAEKFWRFLKRRTQPKTLLSKGMHFAVLGLGDTNYDKFCHMGKSMDARLGEVGGRRVCKVGMADEAMGLEGTVEPWIDALYPALLKVLGLDGQAGAGAVEASPPTTTTATSATTASVGNAAAPAAGVETPAVVAATSVAAAAAPTVNGKEVDKEEAAAAAAAAAAKEDAATAAVTTAVEAKLTLKEQKAMHQNPTEMSGPQMQTRGGALTKESGARWLADMVLSEEFSRIQKEAKEMLKATPLVPYAPSVKIVVSKEEEETAAAAPTPAATKGTSIAGRNPLALAAPIPVAASPSPASVPSTPPTQPPMTMSNGTPHSLQVKTTFPPSSVPSSSSPAGAGTSISPGPISGRLSPFSGVANGGWHSPSISSPTTTSAGAPAAGVAVAAGGTSPYCYEHPARGLVTRARYLTKTAEKTAERRVLEIEIDTSACSPPFPYVPGDAIGLRCPNRPAAVDVVMARVGWRGGRGGGMVKVVAGMALGGLLGAEEWKVEEVVREMMDLEGSPKPHVLRVLASFTQDEEDRAVLFWMGGGGGGSGGGKAMYEKWVVRQRLTIGEVLEMVPSCRPTLAALLDVLSPIPARYYSVASSPLVCPSKLTVAFSVVKYTLAVAGEGEREGGVVRRKGLCTTWLEEMLREAGATGETSGDKIQDLRLSSALPSVSIFLKPAKEFVLPGSAKWPLVLVGPGTGVAPFMGFLSHRRARRAAIESAKAEVCSGYWRGGFEVEGGGGEGGVGGWAQK